MFINSEEHCQPHLSGTNAKMASVHAPGSAWRLFPTTKCLELFIETTSCSPKTVNWAISLGCESCSEPARRRSVNGIETEGNYSPEELIKDVFIGGDCFDVDDSSIIFSGNRNASGVFSNGSSSVDIETGVLLTTGNIRNIEGPNQQYNTGTTYFDRNYDPDLALTLGPGAPPVWDIAALEFDFTPTSDSISFDFVFASEEYCEYAGSAYNDVFGFYISGPGINGPFTNNAENIAFVPGSSDYVTINTINHYLNDNYYVNNIPADQHRDIPFWLRCVNYPQVDGQAIDAIEFDGFTKVLQASARVIPCETYHIKLIIADVNDGYFDSAVFLKANSFNAGGSALLSSEVPGFGNSLAYEGCVDGQFVFERINADTSEDVTVRFNVSGASTATPGVDYAALPNEITIPAGDSVVYLPVDVFTDNLAEGTEEIILELDAPCSCSVPSTRLQITDLNPLALELEPAEVCQDDTLRLIPQLSGGLPGYRFQWSTQDSVSEIIIRADSTRQYQLSVTDICGNSITDSVLIQAVERPEAQLSGDEILCNGKTTANLPLALSGNGPWQVVYEYEATLLDTINDIRTTNFSLLVNQPGQYRLHSVSNSACAGPVSGIASVRYDSIYLSSQSVPVSCSERNDGQISLQSSGGTLPLTYQWQHSSNNEPVATQLAPGDYPIRLIDQMGCFHETSITVELATTIPWVEAGEQDTLTCDQTQLQLNGEGSTGADYAVEWTTIDGQIISAANQFDPWIDRGGAYTLQVSHLPTNCVVTDSLQIIWDTLSPIANIVPLGPSSLSCQDQQTILDGSASQPTGKLSFQWIPPAGNPSPGNGLDTLPQFAINEPGIYRLFVASPDNGCTDETTFTVALDTTAPNVVIQTPPAWTCRDSSLVLDASKSSVDPSFQYQWTTADGIILAGAQSLTVQIGHPTTYRLNIFNPINGCQDSAEVTISADTLAPIADAGSEQMLDCVTSTAELDGSNSNQGPEYAYQWSSIDGYPLSNAQNLRTTVDQVGTYLLTLTNLRNGCQATDFVRVIPNENQPSDLDLIPFPPLCFNGDGQLQIAAVTGGSGPYLYSFDNGLSFQPDTFLTALTPGTYPIIVQDILGCEYRENVVIPNVPPIVLSLNPEVAIQLGENTVLVAQTNLPPDQISQIFWTPEDDLECLQSCLTVTATPLQTSTYTVTVVDTAGCQASASTLVNVDKQRNIFIPNVFSPNQDGTNDFFTVFSDQSVQSIRHLRVFSRWGEEVFSQEGFSPNQELMGWDGTFKGENVNPGVYTFTTQIEFIDGVTKWYHGDVTVVR